MKASDKATLAIGAVGTWIYIGGVDSDLWSRAALGAGMFLLALAAKKIGDYVEACREEQEEREEVKRAYEEVKRLSDQLEAAKQHHLQLVKDLEIAEKSAVDLVDQSTKDLEDSISNIEEINRMVRANLDKEKAEDDAKEYRRQYDQLSEKINAIREKKANLLSSAELPLPELSVKEGELVYKGQKWDNMSGSERLMVSTAIVRKLNPECGFVLLDKLEQMDLQTLQEFGSWLEGEGLQAIATRVSTGDECSIIIEDGYVVGQAQAEQPQQKSWKAGVF